MVRSVLQTFGGEGIEALAVPEAAPEVLTRQVAALAEAYVPDWVVIDHYRLQPRRESGLRAPGGRLMMIDDLGRTHDCDLLLDPGYGRAPDDYLGLVPPNAILLTGPSYALVRPEFAQARPGALVGRNGAPVRRVLLMLGLTDLGGLTGRVAQALLPVLGDVRLDIALGATACSLASLKSLNDPRVSLHVDATDMARLMSEADLAIGAGGSSLWERACLGLPGVTLILADNQRDLALRMAADGLTLAVEAGAPGWKGQLTATVSALARDAAQRSDMSARLAALCDGLGAERAAEAML
jgi:UDP-2,4-diacetamido-2,4,6-trideoxy-beta-L-altropyranose hydrolase